MSSRKPEFPADGAPIPAVAKPGLLYAAAAPASVNIEPLIQVLEQAGIKRQSAGPEHHTLQWQPMTDGGLQHIESQLQKRPDAHLLLFYQAPTISLAQAMANGRAPDDALAEWLESIEGMLAVLRQNRRRTTVVEISLAQQKSNRLIERLNQRLSLSLSNSGKEVLWQPEELDPVYLLIAQNEVQTNTEARRLASELLATALPITDDSSLLLDSFSAWDSYTRRFEKAKGRLAQLEEVSELKKENELLLLQLHHVQEELEAYYLESRDIQKKYQKAEAARKKLERGYNTALQRAGVLQQRIDKMRASRSWRITKPLRVGNILKKKN